MKKSSIEARHSYRFGYLKSEHWQNLRLSKLAQRDAICQRCGHRSLDNDVHHLRYRRLYDVELSDLVVLCRDCHTHVHEMLDEAREALDSDDQAKDAVWITFLKAWGENPSAIPELRSLMVEMRKKRVLLSPRSRAKRVRQKQEFQAALAKTEELLASRQSPKRIVQHPKLDRSAAVREGLRRGFGNAETKPLFVELRRVNFWDTTPKKEETPAQPKG